MSEIVSQAPSLLPVANQAAYNPATNINHIGQNDIPVLYPPTAESIETPAWPPSTEDIARGQSLGEKLASLPEYGADTT
jgi:hypothetical protein